MKKILCLCAFLVLLSSQALCAEAEVYKRQYEALGIEKIYDALPEDALETEISENISLNHGLLVLWERLCEEIGGIFSRGVRCVSVVIAVSMLCGAMGAMAFPGDSPSVNMATNLVGAVAVCAAASGSITSVIGMGKDLVSQVDVFSKALLPAIAAAEAASGVPGAALAKAGAAVFFSDVLITLTNNVLMPLVYVNIFAATANAAAKNESLRKVSDLTTKFISSVLKMMLGAFVSYIAVAGIVSGSVDKAGLKTVQFAASGIPVVGGIVSNAAETVIAGAAVIKNTVGVFGMLAILSACLTPFLTLGINYMLFRGASVLASPVIGGGVSELTDRIGQSFGLVLAMGASCITVIFIAIVAAMNSVGVL